jgi:hypothetical protein
VAISYRHGILIFCISLALWAAVRFVTLKN